MSDQDKAYNPSLVEDKWYAFWEKEGYFTADAKSTKPPYSIILPPPNVTGALHMGHALVDTLQDILIRYKKMRGFETLWVPGTDHAGISTQTVVERDLFEKTGKRRRDFSREEFLNHVWNWKHEYEKRILGQLKRVGCSLDWSRLRFTMDKESTFAVKTVFKKMFDEGLIYRGDYLVNWDPVLQTAIADDEVEHEDKKGSLWYIRYPFADDKNAYLIVATTRPETMLGDVAVAVSPSDERFKKFVGKKLLLPFIHREIPIIEDSYVDPAFGTGVVKITPAHDFNDYEMGKRHNLPLINIMNPDGTITESGLQFAGLPMLEAREKIIQELKNLGLLEKVEPHQNRVGLSYRTKAIIEPYLSKQWFIKMEPFKKKLIDAVKEKRIQIIPEAYEKTYFHWIENLRDWCISRQLWWGHRIPIWYSNKDANRIICHIEDDIPEEVAKNPSEWTQEEDVLDTWFSSALWPFSTLGWPNDAKGDLKKFYPTSTLVTGHDILFFWVARMILMGEYATNQVPFHQTFIHGLIYGKSYWRITQKGDVAYVMGEERLSYEKGNPLPPDVHTKWEKMSKSKGNVIDPIEIINEYGSDAMRITLASSVTHSRQIDLDRRRFEEYKNFANKIWNATRFILLNLEDLTCEELEKGLQKELFTLDDAWLFSRLNKTIKIVSEKMESYDFDEMTKAIYTFFWDEFCAYYLELCKPYLFGKEGSSLVRANKQKILLITLISSIRLMHPIAPFITEEIFSKCRALYGAIRHSSEPYTSDLIKTLLAKSIMIAPYPEVIDPSAISSDVEANFTLFNEIIYAIRNIRAEMQIPPKTAVAVYLEIPDEEMTRLIEKEKAMISALVRIESLTFGAPQKEDIARSATAIVQGIKILIPLPKELQDKEKIRLQKELEKLETLIVSLQKKLADESFLSRAPTELVEKTKNTLIDSEKKQSEMKEKLSSF